MRKLGVAFKRLLRLTGGEKAMKTGGTYSESCKGMRELQFFKTSDIGRTIPFVAEEEVDVAFVNGLMALQWRAGGYGVGYGTEIIFDNCILNMKQSMQWNAVFHCRFPIKRRPLNYGGLV